jgi:GxxExxY protein
VYDGPRLDPGFRADLIVDRLVLVELKSIEAVAAVHREQLLTYLRLARLRLGLLINFNVTLIRDGITRIVNGLDGSDPTPDRASARDLTPCPPPARP